MPGVPISLLIFLRGPVRGMPRNLEPVPLLPDIVPNVVQWQVYTSAVKIVTLNVLEERKFESFTRFSTLRFSLPDPDFWQSILE